MDRTVLAAGFGAAVFVAVGGAVLGLGSAGARPLIAAVGLATLVAVLMRLAAKESYDRWAPLAAAVAGTAGAALSLVGAVGPATIGDSAAVFGALACGLGFGAPAPVLGRVLAGGRLRWAALVVVPALLAGAAAHTPLVDRYGAGGALAAVGLAAVILGGGLHLVVSFAEAGAGARGPASRRPRWNERHPDQALIVAAWWAEITLLAHIGPAPDPLLVAVGLSALPAVLYRQTMAGRRELRRRWTMLWLLAPLVLLLQAGPAVAALESGPGAAAWATASGASFFRGMLLVAAAGTSAGLPRPGTMRRASLWYLALTVSTAPAVGLIGLPPGFSGLAAGALASVLCVDRRRRET